MRAFLIGCILVEVAALVGGAGVLLLEGGSLRPVLAAPRVLKPPLSQAVIGDFVRYERTEAATGKPLGYIDYRIALAVEVAGQNLGREFVLDIHERNSGGQDRTRKMRIRPRSNEHGFLPPLFEEEDREEVPGGTPVIRTIATAAVPLGIPDTATFREVPGFRIDTFIPRRSLTEIAERFWMTDRVPVFGVARMERRGEILTLHSMEFAHR